MNRCLRLKIDESVEKITMSENLCFLCLACINFKINFSKKHLPKLEKQRKMIAEIALKNGVDKALIAEKMSTISANDYPTLKQIERVVSVIEDGIFNWENGFIPDGWIHYKSDAELEADRKRKPVIKKVDADKSELRELCDYIKKEIFGYKLLPYMVDSLKKLRSSDYSYAVIHSTFQQSCADIQKAIQNNSFPDERHKFSYILGIVRNKLPDVYMRMKNTEKAKEKMDSMDFGAAAASGASYQRKTNETLKSLEELW